MAEEQDRIEQIRSRRSRGGIDPSQAQQMQVERQYARRTAQVQKSVEPATAQGMVGAGSPSPWLQDRVSLSLEAQIAMIEMRATYKLGLADMNFHNRQKIISIRPGIFLKVEPTGCYKMAYHNRS